MSPTGTSERLVVVGASVAGVRAVMAARESGFGGSIDLIDREPHLPYDRLPLSKAFLSAADDVVPTLLLETELEKLDVSYHRGVDVRELDLAAREVRSADAAWQYDRLVLATGAKAVRHPWMRDLHGVSVLRSFGDAVDVKRSVEAASEVVLIGGGFIGGEVASHAKGQGKSVTIVDSAAVPLERALGTTVGRRVLDLHVAAGVALFPGQQVESLQGTDHVTGVRLASGLVVPAQAVVVGAGVVPDTGWIRASGLKMRDRDGALLCDRYLRSSDPHVWAAGDAVSWPNDAPGGTVRLENWTNAADQGRYVGEEAHRDARERAFVTVPYFWSDWYGSRIQMVGSVSGEVVEIVNSDGHRPVYLALFGDGTSVVGAVAINCARPVMKLRARIAVDGDWHEAVDVARSLVPARA